MLSAANKIAKTIRKPSLYTLGGRDLDWSLYETQTAEFRAFMSMPFNPDREALAHQLDKNGNIHKVEFATSSCLIHLATHGGWQGPLTYEWLLEYAHFDEIYTSYAEYCRHERANDLTYISKQLSDLQHALYWASIREWSWGVLPEDKAARIMAKLNTLKRQYASEGAKASKPRKALKPAEEGLDLGTCVQRANEFMADCVHRLGSKPYGDLTDEDKTDVVECVMLKLATRGGRGVDLSAIWLALDNDWVFEWLRDNEIRAANMLFKRGDAWELCLYSKRHFIHEALNDMTEILDLFHRCFPWLAFGDDLFTPTFHGVRFTKAHVQEYFPSTTKFDDVFESVCLQHLGARIRPYALRRYNATNLQRIDASKEVKRSHCALMGTGMANMEDTYNARSDLEKSFLASTVQRFQFDPRFDRTVHNRLLPTLGTEGGIQISVARLIRQDQGTELFALFTEVENDCFELSSRMMLTDEAQGFPSARLVPDALNHRQRWRARHASVTGMEHMLEQESISRYEFAVENSLSTPPLLQPKDMVYIPAKCSLAEVLEVVPGAATTINIKVRIATELEANNSMQATYRFAHDAPVQQMLASEVTFPIDLSFDRKVGNFVLRKSMAMESI